MIRRWLRFRRWQKLERFAQPLHVMPCEKIDPGAVYLYDWDEIIKGHDWRDVVMFAGRDLARRRAMRGGIDWPGAE